MKHADRLLKFLCASLPFTKPGECTSKIVLRIRPPKWNAFARPHSQHFAIGHDGLPELSIKTPQEVADTTRTALDTVPPERLYPGANCGMAPMPSDIAYDKLAALAAGAELARKAV